MRTRLKGAVGALVGISAFMAGHAGITDHADAAKVVTPGKGKGNGSGGGSTGGGTGGTTPTPTAPAPSSVSSATVLVNAGSDLNLSGVSDTTAARELFRSASYPQSTGGLDASLTLLNGISAKASRIIGEEYGASIDASGNVALPDGLARALGALKANAYTPHVIVGQRQPAYLTKPASSWTNGDWNGYLDYATRFVRAVAVQFQQTGFPEALFEVGENIVNTADPLQLWTLANPAAAPGDDARYEHYMRVFRIWSRAVDRIAKENPALRLRIGGPAMGGESLYLSNTYWPERFVRDVSAAGLRLDAATLHFYGSVLDGWPNVPGSALQPQLQRIRQALQSVGLGSVPILISEYGPSESSDPVFGRINYSHEGAAWAATFVGEALAGTATVGSYALVRDNFGADSTGVPGIASFNHMSGGTDYPKPAYNALRMFTMLPGARKAVTTPAAQPDVRALASADTASAGLIINNFNYRTADATDLSANQSVTPGFYNLPFTGPVTVERYLVDANTSNAARLIDAAQSLSLDATSLTRVDQCAATADTSGALLLPARVLGPSAVSMWLVKTGAASGLPACSSTDNTAGNQQPAPTPTPTPDTAAPSVPTGLTGSAASSTQINLTWSASTDDVSVSGYRLFRNGTQVTTATGTSYSDSNLTGGTSYTYTVLAYDAAGNVSAQSAAITVTTQAAATPPTDPSSPSTAQDFAARCAAAGVVKCVGFDNATEIPLFTWGANYGITAANTNKGVPELDSVVSASGGASLKFTIPSNSSGDTSGTYFTNFSNDLSVQFGENSEFYVQWRQRFSPEFISTFYNGSGGIKQAIITTGDQPGGRLFASCEAIGVVLQTFYMNRFPILYDSCTGSTSHGPYDGFYEQVPNDFKLQNARPSPYCLYTQYPNNYFPPNGNCYGWFPNEWMTFQIRIKTGPRVNDEWTNSYVSLWVAREGKPSELVINWGPYNLTAGAPTDNERFGKIYLLPYQTGKDPAQTHPTAYTWYDELIISRNKIADPSGAGTTPTTPPGTPPAADTTAPSAPSGLSAAVASSSAINLSWGASTDDTGVSGYRIFRCTGTGCTPTTQEGTVTEPTFVDSALAASTSYTYRVAAYDAAGNASAYSAMVTVTTQADTPTSPPTDPAPGPANTTLQGLADNSLMKLPTLVCTDAEGEYNGACKEVTGYGGMVYDQNRQRMVLFGGGHGGTNYDAIPTLDMITLKWSEEYRATPCSAMTFANYNFDRGTWLSGPSGPYPRPAARHTLDEMMVIGDELVVLANVEGNAPCVATANNIPYTSYTSYELATAAKAAHYNLVTKTWSFSDSVGAALAVYPAAEYDPVSKKVIIFGTNGLEIYDPVTKTKTVAMDFGWGSQVKDEQGTVVPAAELSYNKALVYYPPNQKLYYFGGTEVVEITLNRSNFAASTYTKLSTGYPFGEAHLGYAYDAVNKIIGTIRQNTFYAFNPATKSWSSKAMTGGTPGSVSYKAISYDQVNNVFVFISESFPGGGAAETWAYRYANGK